MMRFDACRAAHVLFGSPRSDMPFRHVLLLLTARDRRAGPPRTGAAGGSSLNAELAHAKGFFR